jgi:DNA processing protein
MPEVMALAGHKTRRTTRAQDADPPKYRPPDPETVALVPILALVDGVRTIDEKQLHRLPGHDVGVFCVGERALVKRKSVAIVGSRDVSEDGAKRARKLAKQLVENKFVVMSGLAEGVDQNAHQAAIDAGGDTIAVIGTPVDKAYPAKHALLQETIYRNHLLISPFPKGYKTQRSSFPERNKLMAALSDGTCIVEASDTSGSLHQAAECARLGRWLFILRSVAENPELKWPRKFLDAPNSGRVKIVDTVEDILSEIR